MKRLVLFTLLSALAMQAGICRSGIVEDFTPACKALDSLLYERTTVRGELELKAVMRRGGYLDFYFTSSLSDMPWTKADGEWFRKELRKRFPEEYAGYRLGRISSRGEKLETLVTGELGADGQPDDVPYRVKRGATSRRTIVERTGGPDFPCGLDGRHIALWQSHGLYFEQSTGRWEWQRPCLFQTVEDLFTQGFVLPFLVPMLENAGAYVMLPRERDFQTHEAIVDNDPYCEDTDPEGGDGGRARGEYSETGDWKDAGCGFADAKAVYGGTDNPFRMGTARMSGCIAEGEGGTRSTAVWRPEIQDRGSYAVYVSYKTLPNSTDAAHYTVHHLGGVSEFLVDQRMGGGTWIYLGTFEFEKGSSGFISLDNTLPKSYRQRKRTVVTADAVKVGGGYGNIARSIEGDSLSLAVTSGMPRFTEGARYWLQWAGMDSTVYSLNERKDDYKDDFMSRGDWVAYMSGGSEMNPDQEGRNIPFDLSFALHTDAGCTPNDSTIGTLAIYTLKSENRRKLPSGEDRRTSREFANLVQSQIVRDIRENFDPDWNRRFIWDRGYRESRTPTCPSMLCELLSHQNFADMKSGQDPAFKFTVSRAIYKGMLKYLSNRYGCPYAVQPLPVNSFSVTFGDGSLKLKWKETEDSAEPTAKAEGFLLYTRLDDGAFDCGREIDAVKDSDGYYVYETSFEPGHIYSFRIEAFNSGGKSFPSETLAAGVPSSRMGTCHATDSCILVVNNFDRVSGPAWFDYPGYAGFDNRIDSGVPYLQETAFTGVMYQNRRDIPWADDDNPGFGASYNDSAGSVIAGNSFDYPYVHGKAIMESGYPFCSSSSEAFCNDTSSIDGPWCVDLICGKQVTVMTQGGKERYRVFGWKMQDALSRYAADGGNILVSGADIATDIWDKVFPVPTDSTLRAASVKFAEEVLGFKYVCGFGSRTGVAAAVPYETGMPKISFGDRIAFNNRLDSRLYSVEAPDGIAPSCPESRTFLRYEDTGISAATCADFGTRRTVCIGFPIETIKDSESMCRIMEASIGYFRTATKKDTDGQEGI